MKFMSYPVNHYLPFSYQFPVFNLVRKNLSKWFGFVKCLFSFVVLVYGFATFLIYLPHFYFESQNFVYVL